MKKNEEESKKVSNFKKFIIFLKESWKVPWKRAGIKLLGYLLFFVLFFLIVIITSGIDRDVNNLNNNKTTTTTSLETSSYTYKQKLLLENKHIVSYDIKIGEEVFKISGNLSNNILEGFLETNFGIKKIRFENNILYEVTDSENIIYDSNINLDFININKIINIVKESRAYIEEIDTNKIYTYNKNDYVIKVYTSDNSIFKIEISSELYLYNLNFDVF